MYKLASATLVAALALVPVTLEAKPPIFGRTNRSGVEKKDTGATVPSAVVQSRVANVCQQIHWVRSLDEAKVLARQQNKPIYYLHALGELDGDACSGFQSLKALSLSDPAVLQALRSNFICCFKNVINEPYIGSSRRHAPDSPAVETTNGAGPHNVQNVFLSADGTVLHALPGYWSPQDMLYYLRYVIGMDQLWKNPNLDLQTKRAMFQQANLWEIRNHPADMRARSHLQRFDAAVERKKADSDFKFRPGDFRPPSQARQDLKSTDQVIHERMAMRPFVPYEQFDLGKFCDYGKFFYDKNEESREPGVAQRQAERRRQMAAATTNQARNVSGDGEESGDRTAQRRKKK